MCMIAKSNWDKAQSMYFLKMWKTLQKSCAQAKRESKKEEKGKIKCKGHMPGENAQIISIN